MVTLASLLQAIPIRKHSIPVASPPRGNNVLTQEVRDHLPFPFYVDSLNLELTPISRMWLPCERGVPKHLLRQMRHEFDDILPIYSTSSDTLDATPMLTDPVSSLHTFTMEPTLFYEELLGVTSIDPVHKPA